MTKITMFDGAATIGGNKIYVEEKNRGVFLDFGMNFAKYKVFYQEFLSDRSARGIYDLISLNLIPKLNIYRIDLIPSDLSVSSFPKLNIEAILLSHAHMDHFGNIGLLDQSYPIVASPSTIMLLKAILDTSYAKLGSEVAYFTQKSLYDKDKRVLKTDRREKSNLGRNFISTSRYSDIFKDFLCTSMKKYKKIQPGTLCTLDEANLPFEVKPYIVDHSIYGATAYILEGDSTIAYTGDFRLHGKKADNSKKFVNNAKNSSILIIEGTRTSREDIDESEDIVFNKCLEAVKESKGLVIADFSARNFERLENFQEIASKVGRTLVIPNKDAYLLKALEKADGIDRTKDTLIYKELKGGMKYWEEKHLKELGKKKYIDPMTISNAPDKYLLCFSLFDMKHLLDIKPIGGTYVYSSSEAFEEESEYDFLRLTKWIETFGLKIYGYKIKEQDGREKPEFVKGYHASGHVSQNDIIWAIETIDPDIIIPVHTENPEWFSENFDNALILQDGQSYEI
ncbi:MAG: MBL fold metallo-hydrolase [Promethearchaeota archaeon]|nr:MAG: MBL fold metallo-hydrolase [Candidatus Lokiarchaeota archaeon]